MLPLSSIFALMKHFNIWVFPKIGGKPPKWMVKIMVPNPVNKWMIWGFSHYFWVDTHISAATGHGLIESEMLPKRDGCDLMNSMDFF